MYDSPPKHPDIASDPTIWIWRRGWISRDRVRIKLQNFPFRPLALLVEWAGQIVRDRNSASGFGPTTLLWDSTTALAWPFADYVKHYETTPMPAALSGRFSGAAIDFSPPSPSRTPTTWLAPTNRMRMPCPWKSHPRHRQKFQLAEPGAGGSRYSRWWWWDWHLRVPVGPTGNPSPPRIPKVCSRVPKSAVLLPFWVFAILPDASRKNGSRGLSRKCSIQNWRRPASCAWFPEKT